MMWHWLHCRCTTAFCSAALATKLVKDKLMLSVALSTSQWTADEIRHHVIHPEIQPCQIAPGNDFISQHMPANPVDFDNPTMGTLHVHGVGLVFRYTS